MKETKKSINLSIIELCSGIGAQIKGINRTNLFNANVVATADLDKEVVVSYAAIHCGLTNTMINEYKDYPSKEQMANELTEKRLGYDLKKDKPYDWKRLSRKKDKTKGIEKYWLADFLSHNLGDIMQIKELPSCDLLTYSTPCTDLSIAGKQEGLKWTCQDCETEYNPSKLNVETRYICPHCGSKNIKSTRSGLLYEVERLLAKAKENNDLPKFLLMENVDALVSKKYIDSFNDWIDRLNDLGYNSYYQTINAKNAGIPQNRNRIFCVSILKDIDTKTYEFPSPFDNGLRLKDLLETDCKVTDKYFLSDKVQARLQITDPNLDKNIIGTTKPDFKVIGQRDVVYKKDSVMGALVATDYKQPKQILESSEEPIYIADLCSEKFSEMHDQSRRVYDENGIAPTICAHSGGNTEPKVSRNNLKIVRKLTPKEAHRLMGFDDEDYEKCKAVGMSDTQGYKQSGNSIVVNVISLLVEHLYKAQYDNTYICTDEEVSRKFYTTTSGINSACKDKPMLVGGIGEINFGKQYRQGNGVYNANHIAMCLTAQPLGNMGGSSCLYAVDELPACLKYQRTEYAKKIRKDYETGKIKERRCNMREYTIRKDGLCNTITTVQKDNYIVVGAAMRGRYNSDGEIEQQIEIRSDDISNAITTVTKDSLIIKKRNK